MGTIVVRYTPKADQADENQKLVEAVYEELTQTQPEGLSYTTMRLADGTFVHVADVEVEHNPLRENAAFARFQDGIVERCEPGLAPNPQEATLVGTYRPPSAG